MIRAQAGREEGVIKAGCLLARRNGRYAIYESIGSLIRSCHQMIMHYSHPIHGELNQLVQLRKDTDGFVSAVMAKRNVAEEAQLVTGSLIAGLGAELAGSQNGHKKAARKELMAAASPTDRLGRRNPVRQSLLLAQARNHLDKRTGEVVPINGSILPWLTALVAYHHERISVLRGIVSTLDRILFKSGNSSTADRSCTRLIARAKTLNVAPFLAYRDPIVSDLREARSRISADGILSLHFLCSAIFRARCALAHIRLEDIRGHLEMLERENRARHFQPEVFERLVDAQRVRLMYFLDNLRSFEASAHWADRLDRPRVLAEKAYSLFIHNDPVAEIVPVLGETLALL